MTLPFKETVKKPSQFAHPGVPRSKKSAILNVASTKFVSITAPVVGYVIWIVSSRET